MADSTLWISESDVVESVGLADALEVLGRAFAAEGAGRVRPMDKTMTTLPSGGTLHSLGAAFDDLVGVKSWAHTGGGADPALLLIDARDGSIIAVIEAFALGQLRTAATAGLATDRMAAQGPTGLGVIGTGKQALAQVAGVAAVRPIEEARVFSPTREHREAFATRVTDELGVPCRAVDSVADAVSGAGIVTLVTRATSPVLLEAMVEPGMHINAVGAIDLARQEFEPMILERAGLVATDSVEQARRLSSELRAWFGAAPRTWEGLHSLGEVVHDGLGRQNPEEITLFKGMGSGTEDVALGAEILERANKSGRGRVIQRSGRKPPRLRTDHETNEDGGSPWQTKSPN